MTTEYINICLADDDEDDRLFFTEAFDELRINTKVQTFNDGVAYRFITKKKKRAKKENLKITKISFNTAVKNLF